MNKKGFTLVELLVVIAIFGILSAVAIINLNKARELNDDKGYKMVCQNLDNGKIVSDQFCQ